MFLCIQLDQKTYKMIDAKYISNELRLFEKAIDWKNYWSNSVKKNISGSILEVGAGLGTSLIVENCTNIKDLLAIHPDNEMTEKIKNKNGAMGNVLVKNAFFKDLDDFKQYDTILYYRCN